MDISQAWTQWICPRFARGYRMDMNGTSWLGQMDILQIRRSGRAWTWAGHGTRNGQRRTRTGPRDAKRSAADTDRATRREAVSGGHGQGHATRGGQRRTRTGPRDAKRSAADTDRATRREAVSGGHGQGHATRSGQRRTRTGPRDARRSAADRDSGHATRGGQRRTRTGPRDEKRSTVDTGQAAHLNARTPSASSAAARKANFYSCP